MHETTIVSQIENENEQEGNLLISYIKQENVGIANSYKSILDTIPTLHGT